MRLMHSPIAIAMLIAAAFAPLVTGCRDKSASASSDVVEISIMLNPDSTGVWRTLVSQFQTLHPDIKVNLIEGASATNAREDQYVTSFLAGKSAYDVIYADVPWIPKFAAGGWLEDLTDRWPKEKWDGYIPAALEGSKYKGRIYRVPLDIGAGMLYYRKDLLASVNEQPPETFDDLVRISQKLQQPTNLWGYVWQGQQYEGLVCDYLEILKGFGGDWINPDTNEVGLDEPAAIKATAFLRDCVGKYGISPPGVTTYEEEQSRQLFHAGSAVFHRNWPYVWGRSQSDGSPIKGKVGITRVPLATGGAHTSTLGGWGFAIAKSSRHKEQAWLFVQFLADLPQANLVYERTGTLLALKSFYDDKEDPAIQQMYKVFQSAVPRPMTPQYAQASDILQRHLSAAISGAATPEQAMHEAARETRLLLPKPTVATVQQTH